MTLEVHVTTVTSRDQIKSAIESLLTTEGVTAANFQEMEVGFSPGLEEWQIIVIADTGA